MLSWHGLKRINEAENTGSIGEENRFCIPLPLHCRALAMPWDCGVVVKKMYWFVGVEIAIQPV